MEYFRKADEAQRKLKPTWIKTRLPSGETYLKLKKLLQSKSLHTVCESALCPNLAECWGRGTATFMILGDVCTRGCRFCAVKTSRGDMNPASPEEPLHVAQAAASLELNHAVVTSVTRDDLPDGGAAIFAQTIRNIRKLQPNCTIEVLVPDFAGKQESLERVLRERPDVLGHNMETVRRLYPMVRPQAAYSRSLNLLQSAKRIRPDILIKTGIMVGLGETVEELLDTIYDLVEAKCDILTIGQYLQPTKRHWPVARFYRPEEFDELGETARHLGFAWVESGPLVRSSYRAEEQVRKLVLEFPFRT